MEIRTRDNRLRAALEDESVCKRRYGSDMAKKLKNRLAALRAAAIVGGLLAAQIRGRTLP